MTYPFKEIEANWQKIWEEKKVFRAENPQPSEALSASASGKPSQAAQKKPFYVLDMFPYPSGSGLHVGHASGYIGTDVISRHKRMQGYNVLHPMGWDAFGLPAEQFAIETGKHPRQTTDENTANYKKQLKLIGLSYDWDREIDTSAPEYYRWTQWVFLKLYEKGLVYQKETPVWWCEALNTVLANEEVIQGRSERGNHPCVRKPLKQWVFRITAYADRLVEDLDELDWPESVKKMQRDWIGKAHGAEVHFPLDEKAQDSVKRFLSSSPQAATQKDGSKAASVGGKIVVFTTRPDTLFGVTALVLAPEHPWVLAMTTAEHQEAVKAYIQATLSKAERDRKAEDEEIRGVATGAFALHPITGEKIPIFIADYVLADYGTGAVMSVPAHDERDFQFSKNMGLKLKPVVTPDHQTSPSSRNVPNLSIQKDHKGQTQKEASSEPISQTECFTEDGVLIDSGEFTGLRSEEARAKITQKLEGLGLGQKRITYKIRDWVFSRQRYWGEPFPLAFDEKGEVVAVAEKDLPVTLPEMNDFKPSPDGSSPLARAKDWVQFVADGKRLSRVTDTMPGWAGSCWYYLRFMDPHNAKAAWGKEAINYWRQVDLYVGGASHAVMHLLYARFWHKALFDLGLVPTKEPFKKLFNQGMVTTFAFKDATGRMVPTQFVEQKGQDYIHKESGLKLERFITAMSKSLRNVVNPETVIAEYGVDAFRLYMLFMGPLDAEKPWAHDGITGCSGFLRKLYHFLYSEEGKLQIADSENSALYRPLHKALKRINDCFELFNFNTGVAALMECLNEIKERKLNLSRDQIAFLAKMLHPFAPHLASQIWKDLGIWREGDLTSYIDYAVWPELDLNQLIENSYELVIQINGKIRKKKQVPIEISQTEAFTLAEQELGALLEGQQIVKKIFVPKKLVNFVVRP